jgi:CRISPR-associated endonuclease/helicase Cas3
MDNIDLIESNKTEYTLVACNHVDTAQPAHRLLEDKVKGTVLLHSRFTRQDRNELEQSLLKQLSKVLVATQIVEISLDPDFEQGFT